MVQYRALVIALILLISTTVPEVHSKSVFERERHDWQAIPNAVANYIFEIVYKVSPKAAQLLVDISHTPVVVETRSFLIREMARLSTVAEILIDKIKNMWNIKVLGY